MANPSGVRITYQFADGGQVDVWVQAASAYPDGLDEARATAVRTFTEAMAAAFDGEDE